MIKSVCLGVGFAGIGFIFSYQRYTTVTTGANLYYYEGEVQRSRFMGYDVAFWFSKLADIGRDVCVKQLNSQILDVHN